MSSADIRKLEKTVADAIQKKQYEIALDKLTELGELHTGLEDCLLIYQKAYSVCKRISTATAKLDVRQNLFFVLRKLAEIHAELGDLKSAAKYLDELVDYSINLNDPCFLQKAYHVGSWVFRTCADENEDLLIKATNYAKKSMAIIRDQGSVIDRLMKEHKSDDLCEKRKSALNQLMGDIYCDRGDNSKARLHFEAAAQYKGLDKEPDLYYVILRALHSTVDSPEERYNLASKMLKAARQCLDERIKATNEAEAEFWSFADKLGVAKMASEDDLKHSMCEIYKVIAKKAAPSDIVEYGRKIVIAIYKVLKRLKALKGNQILDSEKSEERAKVYEKCADYLGDSEVRIYNLALDYYQKMRQFAKKPETLRNALISIAETNNDLQKYENAVNAYDKAIQVEKEMDLTNEEKIDTKISRAICYSNLKTADFDDKWLEFQNIEKMIKNHKTSIWKVYLTAAVNFLETDDANPKAVDFLESYRTMLEDCSEIHSQHSSPKKDYDELDSVPDDYLMKKIGKEVKVWTGIEDLKNKANKKDKNGETELHHACKTDDLERVKLLVEKCGYDINVVDNGGWTPLSEAVDYEKVEILKYLIGKGANVNTKSMEGLAGDGVCTRGGRTPLMEACGKGHAEMIDVLLKAKADVCLMSDANWRASDYLQEYLTENANDPDEAKLKILLKHLKNEEVRRHAVKVPLKKDVIQTKIVPEDKPKRPVVELTEEKRNLLEYEGALNRIGKVSKVRDSILDRALAEHVTEENLNDPDFLEDDMMEDNLNEMADSMEVMTGRYRKTFQMPDVCDVPRTPLIEVNDDNNDDSIEVLPSSKKTSKESSFKRKSSIDTWLQEQEPPMKRTSVPLEVAVSRTSLDDVRTIATRSSGSGSGKGSKRTSSSGVSSMTYSSVSDSTVQVEAHIIDSVTKLEIIKFQFKASRESTTDEIVKTQVCHELELAKIDDYSQLVPEKNGEQVPMNTVLHTLFPDNCYLRKFSMNFIIYDWKPPAPEVLFSCLQINCGLKVVAPINQAMATQILDLSSCDPSSLPNLQSFFKAIVFLFVRPINDAMLLKKIILNGFKVHPLEEKQFSEIITRLLDVVESFDAGNFVMTNGIMNLLAASVTRPNLKEIRLRKAVVKMEILTSFLWKVPNLEMLDLFSIEWIGNHSTRDLIDTICRMINLEHLNVAYLTSFENDHVVDVLKCCTKMKYLDVSETKISSFPTEMAKNLEFLSIQGTLLNVDDSFCEELSKMERLTSINLSKTNFSFSSLEKLTAGKERFEIKAYGVTGTFNGRNVAYALERIRKYCNIKLDIGIPKSKELIKISPNLKSLFVLPGQK